MVDTIDDNKLNATRWKLTVSRENGTTELERLGLSQLKPVLKRIKEQNPNSDGVKLINTTLLVFAYIEHFLQESPLSSPVDRIQIQPLDT